MRSSHAKARHEIPASLQKSLAARVLIAVAVLLLAGSASGDGAGGIDPHTAPPMPRLITPPTSLLVPATPGSGTYLPGSWEVTPAGAFTYSIPLEVPEGRNGMQPSLALSYASGTRNGLLGVGWSLSGLSRITRCNKTLATEGVVDGVDYESYVTDDTTSVDRFCLDGQKLVEIVAPDGNARYGKNGAEYRTEGDIFARITSTVSDTHAPRGPDSFTVEMKSGIVREYSAYLGTRKQSKVMMLNGVVTASEVDLGMFPVEWLLSKERDRSGNEVQYAYDKTSTSYLPSRISYTSHTGDLNANIPEDAQTAQRFVDFTYEALHDPVLAWRGGVLSTQDQRLKSITMSAPNPAVVAKVWAYELDYATSVGSGRTLLKSVRRCGALGGCTRAKQFGWSESASPSFTAKTIARTTANIEDPANAAGVSGGNPPIPLYSDLNNWVPPTTKVFDADGDGLDDVLFYPGDDGGPTKYTSTMRLGHRSAGSVQPLGNGFPAVPISGQSFELGRIPELRPIDVDGDGSVELWTILGYGNTGNHCESLPLHWQSQPPGFAAVGAGSTGIMIPCSMVDYDGPRNDFADLDGDGRLDLIGVRKPLNGPSEFDVRLNLGGNAFGISGLPGLDASEGLRVTDLDGDGRADVVVPGSVKAMLLDDAGALAVRNLNNVAIVPGPGVHFGDFNGDGLEDVLYYNATDTTTARILWNTGNGYVTDDNSIGLPHDVGWQYAGGWPRHPFTDEGIRVVDVDGDGRSDIVSFHTLPTPNITLLLSRGTGEFTPVDLDQDPGFLDAKGGWGSSQLGDFNGDGRADIVTISHGDMVVLEQDPSYADRLMSVTDEQTLWPREEIVYSNEWSDRPDENYACAYPLHCIRHGFPVVRSVASRAHLSTRGDEPQRIKVSVHKKSPGRLARDQLPQRKLGSHVLAR